MNKILLLFGLLTGCVMAPSISENEKQVAQAFIEAMPKQSSLRLLSVGLPLPAQTLADSQISVVVEGHLGAVQTRDRSWIVQVGPNTTILSYASSSGAAGAALNIRGSNGTDVLTMQLAMPKRVVAGDALVVVSQEIPDGTISSTDEAMAVVFVPYPVEVGMLRPPAIGDGFLPRFFRTAAPIYESQLDMNKCPSVINFADIYQPKGPINPAAWGSAPPTVDGILNQIGKFSGEVVDGWPIQSYAPSRQHPGYGTSFAGQVSTALCMMCSTLPLEGRRQIALAIVQRGLDQIGATCDGRVLYPLGGHCAGRKALVIVTGHLLSVEAFASPSRFFPNTFQEDRCYFIKQPSAWWFGANWTAGWAFNLNQGFNGDLLINHPSTWGDPESPNHNTFGWCFRYITQVVPAQVGTALVMHLIHREQEMGALCQMVRQWMGPIPVGAQILNSIYNMNWGHDYAVPTGFCETAYKLLLQ